MHGLRRNARAASVGLLEEALREAAHACGLPAVRERVQALEQAHARVQLGAACARAQQPLAQRCCQPPLPRGLLLRLQQADGKVDASRASARCTGHGWVRLAKNRARMAGCCTRAVHQANAVCMRAVK